MSASKSPDLPGSGGQSAALDQLLALTRGRWRPTVLIVEDHEEVADCLRRALAQMHVLGMVSRDGETALKMASVMRFDFVIMDILLPGKNGFDVMRALRNLPNMRDVPVMIVTCLTDEVSRAKGRQLGAVHYLCKPFELAEFKNHAERILNAEGERQARLQDQRFPGA